MVKQKPTLNNADIDLLSRTFLTKKDAEDFTTKNDLENLASKKDVKRINKKLDRFFNFLDKDLSYFRAKVAHYLGVDVSDLQQQTK